MTAVRRSIVIVAAALGGFLAAGPAQASFPGVNGKIAFERDNEIWTMRPDGSGAVPLTSGGAAKRDPAVSADGKLVAYASGLDIWVIGIDGKGAHAVTTKQLSDQSPAFSPDGKRIAFMRASGNLDIWSVGIDGKGEKDLTNDRYGQETDPDWSPDGTRIAYTRIGCTAGTNEGGVCVYVMNAADGSNQTLLTPEDNYPECPDNQPGFAHRRHSREPSWSPDGKQIAFTGYWNTCAGTGGGTDLWVMNADGSGKRDVTADSAASDRQPSWSPAGDRIAFVSDRVDNPSGPDADIFTVPVQGGAVTPLTSGLFTEDPSWGPLAATAKPGRCANVKRGSKRSERLAGTSFGDRLVGLGGADKLYGLGGADCLSGGDGNDLIVGGKGKDTLDGGSGNDVLRARDGERDVVKCGSGRKDRAVVDKKDRVRGCEKVKRR